MQGNAPDEEHIDPHGECRHRIIQLEDALRKVCIVKQYKPDGKGGHTFEKAFCEICAAECGPDQKIAHVGDCPLVCLNPSQ